MQKTIGLEDGREITLNVCDVCGHAWIQRTERPAVKCPHRPCNAWTWNHGGINHRETPHRAGRPGKLEQQYKGLRPQLDMVTGLHSSLCPCLLCLTDLRQTIKARSDQMFNEWLAKVCPGGQRTSGKHQAKRLEGRTLRGSGPLRSTFAPFRPSVVVSRRCPPKAPEQGMGISL